MKFTVLTCNTNKSRNGLFAKDSSLALENFILSSKADLVFLQEVIGEHKRRKIKGSSFEKLADKIWKDFAYGKNSIYRGGHHGNAILSKFPIIDWKKEDISTNRFEQRGLLYSRIEVLEKQKRKVIDLYCLHLDLFQKGRDRQISYILNRIKENSKDIPYIIAGDFNDWNLKLDKKIKEELNAIECFSFLDGQHAKTFPSYLPLFCLDRIYVKGLRPIKKQDIINDSPFRLSDHLPLSIELDFEK